MRGEHTRRPAAIAGGRAEIEHFQRVGQLGRSGIRSWRTGRDEKGLRQRRFSAGHTGGVSPPCSSCSAPCWSTAQAAPWGGAAR
ncbi:hypothetical protein SAMN05660976_08361 [Nonomuraea pusilla]|uniref:Uncharacterized protein n=1 Tax=Nonomuraea pusilla TaxID=46177 RepID=A0A1H8JIS4_9ACTN|nr:hypothetical protein SAMN05660976_08361 [Nonomuraea pusilla]